MCVHYKDQPVKTFYVYSESHTTPINTPCGQTAEFLPIRAGATIRYNYRCAIKCQQNHIYRRKFNLFILFLLPHNAANLHSSPSHFYLSCSCIYPRARIIRLLISRQRGPLITSNFSFRASRTERNTEGWGCGTL